MGLGLTIIAVTLMLTIFGERLARWHCIHSLLWTTCAHRTNTLHQSRFERLQRFWTPMKLVARPPNKNDVVTFDLSEARNGSLVIEIPPESGWCTLRHTHAQSDGCSDITVLSGLWFVDSATWAIPGPAPPEKPAQWTSMGKLDPITDEATARLRGTIASRVLDHILCSLVQDAEVYFRLCTTPAWIRALHAVMRVAPRLREILVHRMLWVQIRATLHVHDFLEDHGTITIFRMINPWSPPSWVYPFEERMRFAKSRAISGFNYWMGKKVFGMSIGYKEYVPIWADDADQK
jgi:hypothetical protein